MTQPNELQQTIDALVFTVREREAERDELREQLRQTLGQMAFVVDEANAAFMQIQTLRRERDDLRREVETLKDNANVQ